MSFKRDGDSTSLLHNLQRRRVNEVISFHIPDDEAALLKNGRYTCLICSHRPIFDTLSVLSVHRRGKKHLNELAKYLSRKEELQDLNLKKEHTDYLKNQVLPQEEPNPPDDSLDSVWSKSTIDDTSSTQLAKETTNKLTSTVLYNSCSKKGRTSLYHQKVRLNLDTNVKESDSVPTKHPTSVNSQVRHYLKGIRRKPAFKKVVDRARENYNVRSPSDQKGQLSDSTDVSVNTRQTAEDSTSRMLPEGDGKSLKKADYYLNLRMAGWKKNASGEWIKDEEAEFDSDEELPQEYPG